jgi:hypothetical protein
MSCCSIFFSGVLPVTGRPEHAMGRVRRSATLLHIRLEPCPPEPLRDAQRPWEGPAPQRHLEAVPGGVQVCTPALCATLRVRDELEALPQILSDDAQQICLVSPLPASHAGADR